MARTRGTRNGKGRKKIKLEKIENEAHRLATFSKRRVSILKKVAQLSILAGAEIAYIAITPTQKAYTFGHPDVNMVTEKFLTGNLQPMSDAQRYIQEQRMKETAKLLTILETVENDLEQEKKRGKDINKRVTEKAHQYWQKTGIDGNDLPALKVALGNLKVNLEMEKKVRANTERHQALSTFFGKIVHGGIQGGSSSGGNGGWSVSHMPKSSDELRPASPTRSVFKGKEGTVGLTNVYGGAPYSPYSGEGKDFFLINTRKISYSDRPLSPSEDNDDARKSSYRDQPNLSQSENSDDSRSDQPNLSHSEGSDDSRSDQPLSHFEGSDDSRSDHPLSHSEGSDDSRSDQPLSHSEGSDDSRSDHPLSHSEGSDDSRKSSYRDQYLSPSEDSDNDGWSQSDESDSSDSTASQTLVLYNDEEGTVPGMNVNQGANQDFPLNSGENSHRDQGLSTIERSGDVGLSLNAPNSSRLLDSLIRSIDNGGEGSSRGTRVNQGRGNVYGSDVDDWSADYNLAVYGSRTLPGIRIREGSNDDSNVYRSGRVGSTDVAPSPFRPHSLLDRSLPTIPELNVFQGDKSNDKAGDFGKGSSSRGNNLASTEDANPDGVDDNVDWVAEFGGSAPFRGFGK